MYGGIKRFSILFSGVALSALAASAPARAGGFANRQQGVSGQGASYAGVAAGGAVSSMFWNPATMTQFNGMNMEMGASFIIPTTKQEGAGSLNAFGFTDGNENSSDAALTLSSYRTMQLGQNFWVGMSINSPFGLSSNFSNPGWAGAAYGESSLLRTFNATPSVALKLNDWISIGAGVQIQWGKANLMSFNGVSGAGNPNLFLLGGTGWGWGWTAGVTLTPWAGTQIGVGYRSAINQEIEGGLTGSGGLTTPGPASTSVSLPDMLTVSFRQRINAQFTALGTFEWTNWSRIGTSAIAQANGTIALSSSGRAVTLPFEYSDGYYYAGGLEYIVSDAWTVRGGFAFEKSPITDLVRTPRLPDNDRYWYSVGATNTVTPRLSIDIAYSYVQVKDAPMNITASSGNPWFIPGVNYTGTAESNIHILSLGFKLRLDAPPAPVIPGKG